MINSNIDILMISETKLDETFPAAQFNLQGYCNPYRLDRNRNGGGIMLYIREDIPTRLIKRKFQNNSEYFFVEINLRKKRWLICCSYNPHKNCISTHVDFLRRELDHHSSSYENFILLGDFNSEMTDSKLADFCNLFLLKNLIKKPTCFKNPENPKTIDLILTNRPRSFCNSDTLETGLSDFHKLTLTVLKTYFKKQSPKIISYRNYKNFSNDSFRNDLLNEIYSNDISEADLTGFLDACRKSLDYHAPRKKKYTRANQAPFLTKEINKEIMTRSRLRNKFLRCRSDENKKAYNEQRNRCVKLVRNAKKAHYSNLNIKDVTDNKKFWKTVKPLFSEKVNTKENITLVDNNNIISSDIEVAEKLNSFFGNVVKELNINIKEDLLCNVSNINDPVERAIQKYKNHPSIQMIKEKFGYNKTFSFDFVSSDTIFKEIVSLDTNKATHSNDIPTKLIKTNADLFSIFVSNAYNESVTSCIFLSHLKLADITPVHKRNSKLEKSNYRPVSLLSNISKIFERCMHRQISNYFETIFSKFQCGFRKGYNTQDCLLALIENCKRALDKGNEYGALLTDLSKAFDCLPHDLIIAKLQAYGFSLEALKLMNSYLTERKQRVKINDQFSSWLDIEFGVPQGSILGPLLFNIFLCDMFLFCDDVDFASYADDNTPYCTGKNTQEIISQLERSSVSIFKWFENNGMKANPDKCHLLLSKNGNLEVNIDGNRISNSRIEKLLGITIDNQLNFEGHISKICKTASNKLHALARVSQYMDQDKRRILFNSYFLSQFNYCPLIWMNHNKSTNNKINNLHERALRLIYCDHSSNFHELLQRDNSVTIHQKNIQALAILMYKVTNNIAPTVVSELFSFSNVNYNLRSGSQFTQPSVKTVWNGLETISYLGPKVWNMVPTEIKQKPSLPAFKREIKKWIPKNCPCRICKKYLPGVGFI